MTVSGREFRCVLLGGAALLAAAGVAAPPPATASPQARAERAPADHAQRASRCARLRGTDLAPARKVKLVRRRNQADGTDLLGCVLPRGRVRKLTSSSDFETTVESYSIRQVAGAIVLLSSSYGSQYATSKTVSVSNIRTGRQYVIARSCVRLEGPCDAHNATAAAAFVNKRGQAAAAIVPEGTQTTIIAGFSSRGERGDLDSGPSGELPASSLRLDGDTVKWTHSGEMRSATLSG
jgi:hypothetical protein